MVDLGIFPLLGDSPKKEGLSASDLALHTGADRGLIGESFLHNTQKDDYVLIMVIKFASCG